jgi:hypothetical protein
MAKTAIFKMREGSTEFPATYAGTEVAIEIPDMKGTAAENWAEILRFCAGDDDDTRSKAALATFSAKLKLDRQKVTKEVAASDGSFLSPEALATVANSYLATDANRDYGTVKRTAPSASLKAERDAAQAAAEAAVASLVRLSESLKGAAKQAVLDEIANLTGN